MGRYNLLDEKWIPVLLNEKGDSEKVSIIELFENATNYISLAADTQTQKFALLRFLLSIPQTVYFRFDAEGNPYDYFDIDERFRQIEEVEEEDVEKFKLNLGETWKELWNFKSYSKILFDYLEAWRDRFYLFDDKYPFYQVTEDVIGEDKINKAKATTISGKTINRIISESGNKIALFSPKYQSDSNKEILSEDEIARWLLTFQGYVGTADKVMFGKEKYTASKGWIYDIGGIYLEGDNLFETLMLNTMLGNREDFYFKKQKPCWEFSGAEIINRYLIDNNPDNLAELYTTWSRAVFIGHNIDVTKPFEMQVVKVPDIDHRDKFIEPMTMWRKNQTGPNKDSLTPRKHPSDKAMWRSFGNIFLMRQSDNKVPGIIKWYSEISQNIVKDKSVTINAVSMRDDGNATSWMPVGEIHDRLNLQDIVLTDNKDDGWNYIVNDVVEDTKECISSIYLRLLTDINEIRNNNNPPFVNQNIEEMYYIIDLPFRNWLYSIDENSSKEEKVFEWRNTLKELMEKRALRLVEFAGARDYKGIEVERKDKKGKITKNIAISYSFFKTLLNKKLKIKEEEYAGEIE